MTDDAFHLTALDARRYDFGNALRGYDRTRVDLFREQVAEELERLSRANQELEVKARNFHEQLRAFRERDKALNDALISAQQLRGEIREQAQREAQLIIREAQGDAERTVENLRGEIRRAEDELQQLWRNRRSYVHQLRQLAERHLHDLDSAEMVPPPVGVNNPDLSRETVREAPVREMPAREMQAREISTPQVREFQTPREEPRIAPVAQPSAFAQPVPVQGAPAPVMPQQPWARQAAAEQASPQPVASPPLMQPVPHPLPPMTSSPQAVPPSPQAVPPPPQAVPPPPQALPPSPQVVPPLTPRASVPTPSWLDVVEGE